MSANDLRETLTLAIARADGQDWETLDDAPSRGEFMGYPKMADAAIDALGSLFASPEMARAVAQAIEDEQVSGRVAYARRIGRAGRTSIAWHILDLLAVTVGAPSLLDR